MLKVGIVGASGYTGVELTRLLVNHPGVELVVATSRQHAGRKLSDVYPNLRGLTDLVCEDVVLEQLVDRADLFFTAVPHQTAMNIVPAFLEAGKKVVDLSADFRIDDASVYEAWYQTHIAQEYLAEAVYGLPELNRVAIAKARLVANPGCYPTSIILGLAPLLKHRIIDAGTIIADCKSGTSGAGRGAKQATLYCEVTEGFKAYSVGSHRHTPEIEQEIAKLAGNPVKMSFTPHLVPMVRGILSTVYGTLLKDVSQQEVDEMYQDFYRDEKFVRPCSPGTFPATQFVRGSNYCDIGLHVDTRTKRIVVVSAIDNLVKGAAGQAVQNMNLVLGFEESMGLHVVPLFP
ncbi:MAG: N-acetyl-gamma-glutamyl-phosphate reductase [Desulfobulbaceae bacterium]|jgi:N-acetyl-gamma-glutamyl-phosphate reductase|nr:N-acetyl-gamma-glutamyl-phosphate reductase [Desulfobulbaceae bacterium]